MIGSHVKELLEVGFNVIFYTSLLINEKIYHSK